MILETFQVDTGVILNMVTAEDVIEIINLLKTNHIQLWLSSGWGIDALLGKQTRSHKDLDVIMLLDDVLQLFDIMDFECFRLKEIWSENLWVSGPQGIKIATAFILHDLDGREFDTHAMCLDDQGNGIPAWDDEGFIFKKRDLAGVGMIAGVIVQCLTPESQMICHAGYPLPDSHLRDIERLYEKFGVP